MIFEGEYIKGKRYNRKGEENIGNIKFKGHKIGKVTEYYDIGYLNFNANI